MLRVDEVHFNHSIQSNIKTQPSYEELLLEDNKIKGETDYEKQFEPTTKEVCQYAFWDVYSF